MTLEDKRNKRAFTRNHLVTGQLPGRLLADRDVTVLVVDVSRGGMGVVSTHPFEHGACIWLAVGNRTIKLEVRHCRKHKDGEDGATWRCGLKTVADSDDLEGLFIESGVARPSMLLEY